MACGSGQRWPPGPSFPRQVLLAKGECVTPKPLRPCRSQEPLAVLLKKSASLESSCRFVLILPETEGRAGTRLAARKDWQAGLCSCKAALWPTGSCDPRRVLGRRRPPPAVRLLPRVTSLHPPSLETLWGAVGAVAAFGLRTGSDPSRACHFSHWHIEGPLGSSL